jgi:cytoskeletal protein CcmA (bactofilin family)
MFGKSKGDESDTPVPMQQVQRSTAAHSAPDSSESFSSISSGTSIVGKIVSDGTVKIFGRVEGELHAASVQIADGAQVEGDVVAEDLVIGGRVKGTVHANRVRLSGTAVVEGDIFHRSLAIEENARFEGSSRREEAAIDKPTRLQMSRIQSQTQTTANGSTHKSNGVPETEGHAGGYEEVGPQS